MCAATTESLYLSAREQASRAAARRADECCARIAHEKLAAAYATRCERARGAGPASRG